MPMLKIILDELRKTVLRKDSKEPICMNSTEVIATVVIQGISAANALKPSPRPASNRLNRDIEGKLLTIEHPKGVGILSL